MSKNTSVRLSQFIKPERYQLTIKPDLEGFIFEGEEIIHLLLEKSSREITLHSKELEIFGVEYYVLGSKYKAKTSYDVKNETATFSFTKQLPKGKGKLSLSFKGILNDSMRGFYRSRYMHNGKEKYLATTQFEATDARRAFPCFDEPAQKAIFDVTLMVPKGLTAISNTIQTSVLEHESGYNIVKFSPSPKMSTYLLAFIVGDFEFIEGHTRMDTDKKTDGHGQRGTLVRIFVTPGKKHQAKFALETAIKCLEFYNKYFDIAYPLPVLDLIAIPDFSHGAMENWGAVTYRESALLVDPEHSSSSNKQWVALVIAHELAHQWFGNLVTMEWWTHLWLNEGFASYIEYLAIDHIFPQWDIWTQFAYHDLNPALELDSLKHTHPIEIEVHHPDEIGEIFDEISYSKGSSVIRMLAGYLGEKAFRDGLRYYLKKHSYKNASTVHLWEAFEKISKKPVRQLMRNWTGKGGYPVIKIIEEKNKLLLRQSRFFSSPISNRQAKDNTVWNVPISVQSEKFSAKGGSASGEKMKSFLFRKKSSEINKPKGDWIKLNTGETGFYRTDYPAQMLGALHTPIKEKQLKAIDRLGLVRDAFSLAEAGELPTNQALSLIKAYQNETDYTVWVELAGSLASIKNLIHDQSYYPLFEKFCQRVLKKIAVQVGWTAKKGESHTQGLLRSLILSQLAGYNHKKTIEKGLQIFKKSKSVPADIRSVVYQIVAQQGGIKQHQDFINRYKAESLSEEKNRLSRALGHFRDPHLLKKTLFFAMSKEVRIQDTPGIFMGVWANPVGDKIAWEFTKKSWPQLLKKYPASGHMLNRFIKPAANFVTAAAAKDFKAFFRTHKAPGAKRTIEQVLEKIYTNDLWLKRDGKHIERWFIGQTIDS